MASLDLPAYLQRIGFEGEPRVDLDTLVALHRRHLMHIPYENLDVQLGRKLDLDPAKTFDKLVRRRRGGWCYEMNGLFGQALREIGFQVTDLAGAVRRQERGPGSVGNHLLLRIDLDRAYLADVGFGDGLVEPIPLEPGEYRQGARTFRLELRDDGWWRFHNDPRGAAPYFDFTLEPADRQVLATACGDLQTAAESVFVLNMVCQRHTLDGVSLLIGRVMHRPTPGLPAITVLQSPEELVATLAIEFDLDVPEAASLWPAICARHEALFPGVPAPAPSVLLARPPR